MGHGMAGRYLEAGFTVAVWNRSKAKAEDLIARGAQWATSPEDAAIDADAVPLMDIGDNPPPQASGNHPPLPGHRRWCR